MHHCIWPAGEPQQRQSSWDAKSGRVDVEGADYLFELGASQQYNITSRTGRAAPTSTHCSQARLGGC